jgi:putative phosphoribosyl transferase
MTTMTIDTEHPVTIPGNQINLDGILHIPQDATGIVLFAHGSGSSRFSSRNQFVARILNEARLATLLFDLLTPEEDEIDHQTLQFRFDINLLADRLLLATDWIAQHPLTENLNLGYFGASTGGGAAIMAATQRSIVKAVVARGSRPDLAGNALTQIQAPTLFIVGGEDNVVLDLNKKAMTQMSNHPQLEVVPHATHLFEEPGKLAAVAQLARKWFAKHLASC